MAVWREGVIGALAGNAMDMTLRLDHAAASATTATATEALSGVIEEVGAGQTSNQEQWSSGPAEGVTSEARDVAAQIQEGVHRHGDFGGEMRPGKRPERDSGSRVERVDGVGKVQPDILTCIDLSGLGNGADHFGVAEEL